MSHDQATRIDAALERALTLHRQGRLEEARVYYQAVLREQPRCLRAVRLLGGLLMQSGRAQHAADLLTRVLRSDPQEAALHVICGAAHLELRHFQAALDCYEHALALDERNPWAWNNRGIALLELGRPAEAIASFDRALTLAPDNADALYNRGNARRRVQHWDGAVADYDAAIVREPTHESAHLNRGSTLLELHRPLEAIASYDRVIGINPRNAEAFSNRGAALLRLGRAAAALHDFDQVAALHPDRSEPHCNRGHALRELQQYVLAIESYDRAIAKGGSGTGLAGLRLNSKAQICDWRDIDSEIAALTAAIERGEPAADPFFVLSLADSPRLQRQAAESWARATLPASGVAPVLPRPTPRRKIRVGYFSNDFRNHPVAILSAGLFECHDRSAFEVTAFALRLGARDAMRTRLEAAFDGFVELGSMSDADGAQLARSMELDIAVDLGGFTAGARPGIWALRAAPIQAGFLGYTGTLGAGLLDYLIADHTVIPAQHRCHYAEKIVYMPHSFQVNDGKRPIAQTVPARTDLGLPANAFVFCCFNTVSKIMPGSFDGWMRILGQVEGSVLWLLDASPQASNNLRREAQARGVSGHRLIFAPRVPVAEHLARQRCADLFLDSLPFNAHTTASDALWAGLPVLTRMGDAFSGRVAASLLAAIDLPQLITSTQDQFERRAVQIARDPLLLDTLRRQLAANRLTKPLFDTRLFARNLEAAYRRMLERHRAGLPAEHLDASPAPVMK